MAGRGKEEMKERDLKRIYGSFGTGHLGQGLSLPPPQALQPGTAEGRALGYRDQDLPAPAAPRPGCTKRPPGEPGNTDSWALLEF